MNRQVSSRRLHRREGTEGPSHDPYSVTTRVVEVNGKEVRLRQGIGTRLTVDGQEFTGDDTELESRFASITGMTVRQFDQYYDRVHPYFEDPMGPLSRYI